MTGRSISVLKDVLPLKENCAQGCNDHREASLYICLLDWGHDPLDAWHVLTHKLL